MEKVAQYLFGDLSKVWLELAWLLLGMQPCRSIPFMEVELEQE